MSRSSPAIVCMGEPLVEFNQVDRGSMYLLGHGGDTSNCAIAAARAGASVGYVTALGEDEFGESFVRLWEENGVDFSRVRRRSDAHTGVYFVTHGPNGHEFSYMRAGSAASLMGPSDLPADYIAAAEFLHVSGISMAISTSAADAVFEAIDIARRNGVAVSFDTNLRLKLWPLQRASAMIEAAVRRSDVVLPGMEDTRQLTGLDDPDRMVDHYLALGAGVVALTLGDDGCLVATPDERRKIAGLKVNVVDATAAGDTFDGFFLAEYSRHRNPFQAARFANVAAALSTLGYGAVAPMPYLADVVAAIEASEG